MSYQITSAILGILLAGSIFWLIRRDHIHTRHAAWWLIIAVLVMLLGIFPYIIDWMAAHLGINYPPTLLFILSISLILIKILTIDIENARLERKMRRLAQRMALVQGELEARTGSPVRLVLPVREDKAD